MNVVNMHALYYMSVYQGSTTLTALEKNDMLLDKKYYKPKEISKKLSK